MTEPTRVLLVEDNAGDALLVTEALEEVVGPDVLAVDRVADLASATTRLEAGDVDCVLLDLGLPDARGGIDALHRVLAASSETPVVVLTGRDDNELAADAIAAGAQDYLVKTADPSPTELLRAVEFARRRAGTVATLRTERDDLTDFAKRVAHDLRGPLATMTGFARLLQSAGDRMSEAERDDALERIADVGHRMAAMIDSMLRFAQLAGRDLGPVRLHDVVDWVEPLVAQRYEDAGARLVVDDLPVAQGDEPALRTVVLNLLSNAVAYRDPDRRLEVRVHAATDGDDVLLLVDDNGRGIPADRRDQVFEIGQRLHPGIGPEGVGLGLATVRRIVQQLHGSVHVEDNPAGQGVRFVVRLPASDVATRD